MLMKTNQKVRLGFPEYTSVTVWLYSSLSVTHCGNSPLKPIGLGIFFVEIKWYLNCDGAI